MRLTYAHGPCASFFGVFAKRTQFLRLLCGLPWFMRMTYAQLFGVFSRNKPDFVRILCAFISSRRSMEAMPRLKIVIPTGRPASGIGAYGKWIASAGALCRCPSVGLLRREQIRHTPIPWTGVRRFSRRCGKLASAISASALAWAGSSRRGSLLSPRLAQV